MGAKKIKASLLPQIAFKFFQTSLEFSSQWTSQKLFCVLNLEFPIFCSFVFVNIGPHESKNVKTLLLNEIAFNFLPSPEFSSEWSLQM